MTFLYMEKGWPGLPYQSISDHYKRIFKEKVYKIPVSVVDDCPNRMGLKGMKTCSFCDVWGSAAQAESFSLPLAEQITRYHKQIQQKYRAKKFLVYFQAYTNTFTKVASLRSNFDTALAHPFVVGLVVGTRPDCLSEAVLKLWQEHCLNTYVGVELGVQSFFDKHLEFFRRGHSAKDSLDAIEKISARTSVDLGIHLIFGSPEENHQQIIETAKICNSLPITNVKLHNLHVLKNTALESLFHDGNFIPISQQEYTDKVALFLSYLHPRIAVHRLAAYAPRWDELVAPAWTADKMKPHQEIIDYLRAKKIYQGSGLFEESEDPSKLSWQDRELFNQMSQRIVRNDDTTLV